MIKRLIGKELIEESLLELLDAETVEDISVTQIAKNCGITTRTFYNHFRDKNEVVSSIYSRCMRPHLDCRIDEWYNYLADCFVGLRKFFEHSLVYNGQNCLSDAIISLEWEKLERHIKPEVMRDKEQLQRTRIAIEYMLHGNLGSLLNTFVHKRDSSIMEFYSSAYGEAWKYLSANIPPLILQNLDMYPVNR